MAYYYLISSLPMLKSDGDMPLSYEQFLSACRDSVKDDKYQMLKELSLSSSEGPLLSEWAKFYGVLTDELTYQRNIRLGRGAKAPEQKDESVSKLIASALNNKNPLEAEKMLLGLEFERLDELIGTHYFDDYALLGYALKLKLLERRKIFDKERGKNELHRIVGNLEQQIVSMEQE